MKILAALTASFLAASTLTGCLVIGYSPRSGAFMWPGGWALVITIIAVFLLLRRRR